MALVKRHIRLTFQLGSGDFGDGKGDTFTVEGLRAIVNISKAGLVMAECNLRVFGMKLDTMNALSILGTNYNDVRNNTLTVEAGTDRAGLSVVFQGTIQEAWVDARNMPEVSFTAVARTGLIAALKPVPPTSYKGSIDVGLAMSGIATQMGLQFENSGVQGVISNPYLYGDLRTQATDLAAHIPCNLAIEPDKLAIWPQNGSRGNTAVRIAPDTGMIGYPIHTQTGFTVQTLFNSSIDYGTTIMVESAIAQANGSWTVYSVIHDLEAEVPGGKWFTTIDCHLFGLQI